MKQRIILAGALLVAAAIGDARSSAKTASAPVPQAAPPAPKILWSDSFASDQWKTAWKVSADDWGSELRERASRTPSSGPSQGGTGGTSGTAGGTRRNDEVNFLIDGPPSFLRVHFPLGSSSPNSHRVYGSPMGGTQWYAKPIAPADDLHLRYYVRFADDFGWNKGGKLPGLFGGKCCSGGCVPDGTNGFSTRYMWRSKGAGEVYAYLDMPSPKGFGISISRGSWTFKTGEWCCIEQEVHLNAPAASDGTITVWINDSQVLRATGLKFRTVDALKIEGILFSTFYGGDDATWGAPKTTAADFGAFALSTSHIGL
jgi:hypothetical protein